jgi:hypothetical protein
MEPPPQDAQSAFPPSTGLALASLVLGIAAVGLSFLVIGFLFGAIGIVLGYVYLNKKHCPKGMARWGIGLSIFGMLVSVGFGVLFYLFLHEMKGSTAANVSTTMVTGVPANPPPLTNDNPLLKSNLVWSATMPGAQALCAGDWESDGSTRVLVAAGHTLHILDLTGADKSTLPLPEPFTEIECGRNKTAGARLLGCVASRQKVWVLDHAGKKVWSESAFFGLDGAHWGDLTGDGNDSMIIGMNGLGGLKALSPDGKKLWSTSLGNVWSQAIVPAASNRPAMVLATDAGGTVNVFDATGHRSKSFGSGGGYFAQMTAGAVDSHAVQILAFNGAAVEAFDLTGNASWTTPATANIGEPRACAVMGDFKGDGTHQWAFLDAGADLVIVTTGGLKVSSILKQSRIQQFAVAPRPGQGALLLTLDGGVVRAYSFGP